MTGGSKHRAKPQGAARSKPSHGSSHGSLGGGSQRKKPYSPPRRETGGGARQSVLEFDDNVLVKGLVGAHDRNLARIEQWLGVELAPRGNRIVVSGDGPARSRAVAVLNRLYERLKKGLPVDAGDVDGAVRLTPDDGEVDGAPAGDRQSDGEFAIRTRKRLIVPRSPGQVAYLRALRDNELVFGLGPAGTGKTYLAVAMGVSMLVRGEVERIILSRPAIEAGERLGFLPGDLKDKIDPYLQPLYDALYDMLPAEQVQHKLESGEVEIAPLAFMRGRTLSHAFAILDEAQNTTPVQMKMFLTRLGENSRMVVVGDDSQVDLPHGARSGLIDAVEVLGKAPGMATVRLTNADVVRHSLVTRILEAYGKSEAARRRRKAGDAEAAKSESVQSHPDDERHHE
jgi:phosphate starvation-inducible protein PhoH and related proteins